VVPDLTEVASLWTQPPDLGGILGLEIRQQLPLPVPRALKVALDYGVTIFGGAVILPVIAAIALAALLSSTGPVFYGQRRIGMDGRRSDRDGWTEV
jgi:lipopolysaccharide/colanic/teichoic acid biosynthesis glycosyltransferase